MRYQHSLLLGLCVFLAALPELYAQEGGRRGRGGRFWGDGGYRNRQFDRSRESFFTGAPGFNPSVSDGSPANSTAGPSTPSTTPAVPGFGVEKKQPSVPGFGDPQKTSPAKKSSASGASGTEKSANEKASSSTGPSSKAIRDSARSLIRQFDENKDGKLQREEWMKKKGLFQGADKDGDGVITLDELTGRVNQYSAQDRGGGEKGARDSNDSRSRFGSNLAYRFPTPTERLPEGLPDWFARKDADGDGQISMAEFSSFWTVAKAHEFSQYDLNNDGIITPAECLKVEKKK
jgi:Ca2+-binding EF-hand superfamily protein